jgi:antitoxin ParD1/3/4
MDSTLNLSLTDELRAFVDGESGDGTMYATPSEFVPDLIRKHKQPSTSTHSIDVLL